MKKQIYFKRLLVHPHKGVVSRFLLSEERPRLISASKTLFHQNRLTLLFKEVSRTFFLNRSVLQPFFDSDPISGVFAHFPKNH